MGWQIQAVQYNTGVLVRGSVLQWKADVQMFVLKFDNGSTEMATLPHDAVQVVSAASGRALSWADFFAGVDSSGVGAGCAAAAHHSTQPPPQQLLPPPPLPAQALSPQQHDHGHPPPLPRHTSSPLPIHAISFDHALLDTAFEAKAELLVENAFVPTDCAAFALSMATPGGEMAAVAAAAVAMAVPIAAELAPEVDEEISPGEIVDLAGFCAPAAVVEADTPAAPDSTTPSAAPPATAPPPAAAPSPAAAAVSLGPCVLLLEDFLASADGLDGLIGAAPPPEPPPSASSGSAPAAPSTAPRLRMTENRPDGSLPCPDADVVVVRMARAAGGPGGDAATELSLLHCVAASELAAYWRDCQAMLTSTFGGGRAEVRRRAVELHAGMLRGMRAVLGAMRALEAVASSRGVSSAAVMRAAVAQLASHMSSAAMQSTLMRGAPAAIKCVEAALDAFGTAAALEARIAAVGSGQRGEASLDSFEVLMLSLMLDVSLELFGRDASLAPDDPTVVVARPLSGAPDATDGHTQRTVRLLVATDDAGRHRYDLLFPREA